MADLFNGPGIGKFANMFGKNPIGTALVLGRAGTGVRQPNLSALSTQTRAGITSAANNNDLFGLNFLVQSWTLVRSERIQEVVTLAETEHVYTFGKNLPRVTMSGYFINSKTRGRQDTQSREVSLFWKTILRAKISGQEGKLNVVVALDAMNDTLQCVAESINVSGNVNQEALIEATLQLVVLNG